MNLARCTAEAGRRWDGVAVRCEEPECPVGVVTIAERLAITVSAARHRYAAYSVWRRHHPSAPSDGDVIPY